MALETGTYISDLNINNPTPTDPKSQGDDHIRLLKNTIQTTFPNIAGAVTPTHTELNYVDGVTSNIQTQLDDITTLASGKIYVGSAGGVATERTITGDISIDNTGVAAISSGVIVNADISASAAIALSKLATGTASTLAEFSGAGVLQAGSSAVSTGSSGYIKLPASMGGFMLQWGTHDPSATTNQSVTFPTTFATACVSVVITLSLAAGGASGADTVLVGSPTTSGFTYNSGLGANAGSLIYYIAIGY